MNLAYTAKHSLAAALLIVAGCGQSSDGSSEQPPTELVKGNHMNDTSTPAAEGRNRLAHEKSPYLLQHANNPVDWYPWGEEAFAKARAEDKPIFLSIGYSTCHWCHVMEHESFEDEQVAALMNEAFVNIKVDREERPDIDSIYMSVCQIMTGRGGWPLTIIMMPDREPFFAATYIPKRGMLGLIPKVSQVWTNERSRILEDAAKLGEALRKSASSPPGDELDVELLTTALNQLSSRYDETYGGFGTAPKFPSPHNLMFLLRQWKRSDNPRALKMVENTLVQMRRGGMFDHVGFGFHRYSTDQRWFLPHFEKMLYDQAMLAMAYTEAFQATGKEEYRRTVDEIFTYVLRDMTDAAGGFYSAEDADSEGEEGKFYLWAQSELEQILGAGDAALAAEVWGAEAEGNYREEAGGHQTGANLLYLPRSMAESAAAHDMSEDALRERMSSIRQKLFDVREKRIHPGKDDKILTDWNGLMIVAMAKAGRAFGEQRYIDAAAAAIAFLNKHMKTPDGGLYHRYRGGDASIGAMIDDYAFVVWGLLETYEATFDVSYLKSALDYNAIMMDRFWDDATGGFFLTPDDGEKLIIRPKDAYDGAVPSGNSVSMLNMLRLGRITAEASHEERARAIGKAFDSQVTRVPASFTQMLMAVDFQAGPSFEIVIAGERDAPDTREMRAVLDQNFIPNKVVLLRPAGPGSDIVSLAPYTELQTAIDGKATAYVCRNYACELPTTDAQEMMRLIAAASH